MHKIKLSFLFIIFHIIAYSQDNNIKGNVKDKNGEPLLGVTVQVKGARTGITSDFDGNYTINTKDKKEGVLVFSYLGFASKELKFTPDTKILNVVLIESAEQLEEIVVTALNIKRDKKSLTYATQGISTEDLTEARSSNLLNSLSGKASGVQIVSSSTPTGTARVIIRGLTSITGGNQPLYVLDGIALDNSAGDGGVSVWDSGDDIDLGNPISAINPDDIESIQVLKGANAAALYGSRASNGVILITTKQAKKSDKKINVNINSNLSIVSNREYPNYQYVYGAGQNGRLVTNTSRIDTETGLPIVGAYRRAFGLPLLGQQVLDFNGTIGSYLPNVNNVKELYKIGKVVTNTASINSATDKTSLRFSFSNTFGDHVIERMEKVNRNNIAIRFSHKFSDKFKVNSSLIYFNQKVENRLYQNGSNRNPASNYIYILPNMSAENLNPYKDENGNAFSYQGPFNNPYWNIFENRNQDIINRLAANVVLDWKITKGLSLRTSVNSAIVNVDRFEFNNYGAAFDPDGLYREVNSNRQNWNFEAILNYSKKINSFSLVSFVGVNKYDLRVSGERRTAVSLLERDEIGFSNANEFAPLQYLINNRTINSIFASTSLGLDDTYFVDLTARNDWASTLPLHNNSYFYPSIGTSIVFSNFLPRNNLLNFGKFRASYAEVGNDGDSPAFPAFDRLENNFQPGGVYNNTEWLFRQERKNNPNLAPELTNSVEFGLETKLFNNRVSLDATIYKSSTDGQIIPVQVTPTSGFTSSIVNAGEIKNNGVELFMSAKIIDSKFKWQSDFNWSTNQTIVGSLINGVDRLLLRNWFNVGVFAEVGQPFGNIRGTAQVTDPETGTPLILPNGRVLWDDDQLLGNAQPDWIGSIRNAFSYKRFSFNFLIDVKKGGDLYSATMLRAVSAGVHSESLFGREGFLLSSLVLNENNNERAGIGLFGNDYTNTGTPKGAFYKGAAIGELNEDGQWVAQRDTEGNVIFSEIYLNPELYAFDGEQDQRRYIYDASYVKLREVVFGYTFNPSKLKKIKNLKISVVGRDLWTIYRNTPQGIDPEANTTSGNGQGIEFGSFLPTRTVGLNVKLGF